jgi:hypothetical protein
MDPDISEIDMEDIILQKKMFVGEAVEIVKKLNMILEKFMTITKNEKLVNVNKSLLWFTAEQTFMDPSELIIDPFEENIFISNIISIIWKLVDFVSDQFIKDKNLLERKKNYVVQLMNEKIKEVEHDEKLVDFQKRLYGIHIEKIEETIKLCIDQFREYHMIFKAIRIYFLKMFTSPIFLGNKNYLFFLPKCVLNVFRSSIIFIDDDKDFLNFIVRFDDWIPTEFRCNYMSEIIKKIINKSIDTNIFAYIKLDLILDDTITLYKKYLKDQSFFNDIQTLSTLTYIYFKILPRKMDLLIINKKKITHYLSIELAMISKILNIFEEDPENNIDLKTTLHPHLFCIESVLKADMSVINSYLVYHMYNTLYPLYLNEKCMMHLDIQSELNNIFCVLLEHRLTIIYMATTLDGNISNKLYLTSEQYDKFVLWSNIYKKISESSHDELTDPLTTTCIVDPCFISMNKENTILQVCDINMLQSYLWTKPENPFTREPLSVEDLENFNSSVICKEKIKEFKKLLGDTVKTIKSKM